ncbi:type II toxin-antitoxin system RelE/ParE family toxin [Sphingomonas sp. Y38-1Y]|uniref:type II toxin-antitoxin system RelE/ParE family toxin n=1 Tax=Sphingomonas sp. Y38-1Y TaxID=3078265 RepID=UPI0028EF8238|nr:type II toxin-antitoxin system RelE/ParE family toxin [Sphingomonas sp. Y38-1Y]
MAKVVWLRPAIVEIDQIAAYVRVFDPTAAERLAASLYALGESLSEFPNRGRPASNGARELVTLRPYIIRYLVLGDEVLILRVRHGARRPDE